MSPPGEWQYTTVIGFPRVSGDEPIPRALRGYRIGFSPRERG